MRLVAFILIYHYICFLFPASGSFFVFHVHFVVAIFLASSAVGVFHGLSHHVTLFVYSNLITCKYNCGTTFYWVFFQVWFGKTVRLKYKFLSFVVVNFTAIFIVFRILFIKPKSFSLSLYLSLVLWIVDVSISLTLFSSFLFFVVKPPFPITITITIVILFFASFSFIFNFLFQLWIFIHAFDDNDDGFGFFESSFYGSYRSLYS